MPDFHSTRHCWALIGQFTPMLYTCSVNTDCGCMHVMQAGCCILLHITSLQIGADYPTTNRYVLIFSLYSAYIQLTGRRLHRAPITNTVVWRFSCVVDLFAASLRLSIRYLIQLQTSVLLALHSCVAACYVPKCLPASVGRERDSWHVKNCVAPQEMS